MNLEHRYLRWAAVFYPAGYLRERGSELAGTYLALAAPDRRRPSAADVADLAAGGLREHLRSAAGLTAGARLAGLIALITTTAFATGWTVLEVVTPVPPWSQPVGRFLTLGIVAWAAWLTAAVVHAAAPGRWYRRATVLALLATAAVVPASALTGLPRPPLVVLLPQFALGVVALAADGRRRPVRFAPPAAALVAVVVAVGTAPGPDFYGGYYWVAATALTGAAGALLTGTALLASGLTAGGDHRGWWALLILLGPIGTLALQPLDAALGDGWSPTPAWESMAAAAALVTVLGAAVTPLVVVVRIRRGR